MNFPNFPLYASLKKSEFAELTNEQKDYLTDSIKTMNEDEHEKVYGIIRAYHLEHDDCHEDIPYGGKILKTGIKFDVDCLPSKLQYILYTFSKLDKL